MEENEQLNEAKELLDSHLNETIDEELSAADLAHHLKTLKKHDEELFAQYLEKLDPEMLGDVAIEMPDTKKIEPARTCKPSFSPRI